MPMFTLYCDDSGTHSASDVAIAGCYIATVEQWGELKRNWDEINAREKFGVFHIISHGRFCCQTGTVRASRMAG